MTCYQCGDVITEDRFGKWTHTHGTPDNGHAARPEPPPEVVAYYDGRGEPVPFRPRPLPK